MNRVLKYFLFGISTMILSNCGAKEDPIITKVKVPNKDQNIITEVKYIDHNNNNYLDHLVQ